MFRKVVQKKIKNGKWTTVNSMPVNAPFYSNDFIIADRAKAKKDGDRYRVYQKTSRDGLRKRPYKVITTNINKPGERVLYLKVRGGKK